MRSLCFIISRNRKSLFFLCTVFYAAGISAQVHIGSENPPHASAMLEISATDKGVLLPSVVLTSVDDISMILNKKPVDGLLVFNELDDPNQNLYRGMYAWNGAKARWEHIASDQSFLDAISFHFATEEAYLVANVRENEQDKMQKMKSGAPPVRLDFRSGVSLNKNNCFNNDVFTVPKVGHYKISCGLEVSMPSGQAEASADSIALLVVRSPFNSSREEEIISSKIIRGYDCKTIIYKPFTPSVVYNGKLEGGDRISVKASILLSRKEYSGAIAGKYLYITSF